MIDRPTHDAAAGFHAMDTRPRPLRISAENARYIGRNKTARDILVLLRIRRRLTAKELADFLRLPWSTVRGHLLRLRAFGMIAEDGHDRGATLWTRD